MASNEAVPETRGSQVNEKNQGLMLSYRHYQKKVVNKIRDRLRKQGYDIWIDQEKMAGSLKTKMTEAVKKAGIVLICLSKEYEQSKNCKFECERIKEFKKPFIALQMETYQRRRGSWVKQLIKDNFYVNFTNNTNKAKFNESFNELLRVLRITERKIAEEQLQDLRSKAGPSQGGGIGGASSSQQQPAGGSGGAPSSQQQPAGGSGGASSSQQQPAGGSGGVSSSQQKSGGDISEDDYIDLLNAVSDWWSSFASIHMMKVLLRQFKDKLGANELQETNDVIDLFKLMKGVGKASSSKHEMVLEVVKICSLDGVQTTIRKLGPTFEHFKLEDVEIKTFSSYRRKLIKFGKSLVRDAIVTIGHLYDIPENKHKKDPWLLICALEDKRIIQENSAEKLIERLRKNRMDIYADILESPL